MVALELSKSLGLRRTPSRRARNELWATKRGVCECQINLKSLAVETILEPRLFKFGPPRSGAVLARPDMRTNGAAVASLPVEQTLENNLPALLAFAAANAERGGARVKFNGKTQFVNSSKVPEGAGSIDQSINLGGASLPSAGSLAGSPHLAAWLATGSPLWRHRRRRRPAARRPIELECALD